jgi:cholesterol oxidase
MERKYDVVVVGSGFGGSINAYRLSKAGHKVVVLERGKEYKPGEFPRDVRQVNDLFWRYPKHRESLGLYDVRFFSGIATVSASGVGGGSLIYANIHYRPQAIIFENPRWPKCFNLDTLDAYYQMVAEELGISPVPADIPIKKRDVFLEAARQMGREVFDVPQAVSWKQVEGPGRQPCQLVAECEFGCNYGSKNTLDFTYLAGAQQCGASLQTGVMVSHISPAGDGYEVHFENTDTGEGGTLIGRRVVLAAGALGSTEILLRSRDVTRTLPNLSAQLGKGYSGNGDFIGNIQNSGTDLEPWYGPDVTSVMWFFNEQPEFTLAAPTFNKPVMEVLAAMGQPRANFFLHLLSPLVWKLLPWALPWSFRKGFLSRPRPRPGKNAGPPSRMTNLFAIGRDNAGGRMVLHRNSLDIKWDYHKENKALVERQEEGMRQLAGCYGGTYGPLLIWSLFKKIITVHNLGGCNLSSSPDTGVVSTDGEVHGYPGLYVSDGAVIPTSIGSHPVMTISAVSEWIAEKVAASFS